MKLRSCDFHHRPTSSFCGISFIQKFQRVPSEQGQGEVEKKQAIFYLYASMSPKRYDIRPKLLLMTNRKLHMRFRLASRSMTLDDLELEKENNIFSSFRRQYLANSTHRCRALTFASARLSLSCIFKKQVYYLGSWRCILTPTG